MRGNLPPMRPKTIPLSLVEDLDSLCYLCPKGEYTGRCPFKVFSGISRPSRMSLFAQIDREQIAELFDLATDCTCPKDPRQENKISPS